VAKLTDDEINAALADLPGWSFDGSHIRKEFVFKGFRAAIAFIVRIAFDAEAADHHPDLENHYNKVIVAFRTWDQDGITDADVTLAGKAEKAAASFA
jgi:4a-hydroxytetrahydrobiopterin dehydratase